MRKFRIIGLILCIGLLLGSTSFKTVAVNEAKAKSFRLEKVEGTAQVISAKGKTVSLTEGMQIYSGDTLRTDAKSYAYISLDSDKLIKMDELSQVVCKRSGKKLQIELQEGSLYFEVNEKLAADESMTVATSNISLSIRGTAGVVRKRDEQGKLHDTVWLLDGSVELSGIGAAKNREPITVWGGEKVTYIENSGSYERDLISVMDIPGFAGVSMSSNTVLMNKVLAKAGLDTEWITINAPQKMLQDQSENQAAYGDIFQKMQKPSPQPVPTVTPQQEAAEETTPLPKTPEPVADTDSGENDGGGSEEDAKPTATPTVTPTQTPSEEGPFTVRFLDWEGRVLSTQVVKYGERLNYPDIPNREGYRFIEWDPNFEDDEGVIQDTDFVTIYEPIYNATPTPTVTPTETPTPTPTPETEYFTVHFYDGPDTNSVCISDQQVEKNKFATPPEPKSWKIPDGYEFVGWSGAVDDPITMNTDFFAQYKKVEIETPTPTATPAPTPTATPTATPTQIGGSDSGSTGGGA